MFGITQDWKPKSPLSLAPLFATVIGQKPFGSFLAWQVRLEFVSWEAATCRSGCMRKCDAGYAGDLLSDTIATSWCRINVRYVKNKGERWAYCKKKQKRVKWVSKTYDEIGVVCLKKNLRWYPQQWVHALVHRTCWKTSSPKHSSHGSRDENSFHDHNPGTQLVHCFFAMYFLIFLFLILGIFFHLPLRHLS